MALKKKIKKSGTSGKKKALKAPVKKTARKKTAKKKSIKKKITAKKTRSKTARKRTAAGTTAKKKTIQKKKLSGRPLVKKQLEVEPGPPSGSVPPVEAPVQQEEAIGIVTHYYSHLGVAVVQLNKGTLKAGDKIHIKGHSTDFTQMVTSLEYEHQHVDQAIAGQAVGIKVNEHAREHDILYMVK